MGCVIAHRAFRRRCLHSQSSLLVSRSPASAVYPTASSDPTRVTGTDSDGRPPATFDPAHTTALLELSGQLDARDDPFLIYLYVAVIQAEVRMCRD